jgi:hypothetical protein
VSFYDAGGDDGVIFLRVVHQVNTPHGPVVEAVHEGLGDGHVPLVLGTVALALAHLVQGVTVTCHVCK